MKYARLLFTIPISSTAMLQKALSTFLKIMLLLLLMMILLWLLMASKKMMDGQRQSEGQLNKEERNYS